MSKQWDEHSAEEQREILDRIAFIYAEHKHPTWLKKPQIYNIMGKELVEKSELAHRIWI
jgi:hypothetical protein